MNTNAQTGKKEKKETYPEVVDFLQSMQVALTEGRGDKARDQLQGKQRSGISLIELIWSRKIRKIIKNKTERILIQKDRKNDSL